jgi:NADH-ubiquinone oxidoreductase chain 5
MVLLTLLLPLLGSLISGLLGRLLGYNSSKYIASLCIIIPCIYSWYLYYNVMVLNIIYNINLFNWITIDNIEIDWAFIIDELSVTLLVAVCTISSLVHIYATSYMSHDPHQQRFFSILSLFTSFMIILVTASNYLVMFVGWEMIGVSSYLLIGHWHTRLAAMKSGLNAFLMNKFGDTFMTIGLFLILITFGSFNFSTIYSLSSYINTDILTLIMLCLLIGAVAKSAQLGLHTWLLNSMEGPTPVSSLLHAACLVCAGIYLLIRSSYLLEYTPTVLLIILWLGGLTTLIAGIIAIVTNDIKKIIALSTMSQLGLMVLAIGLSSYQVSIYHLFTHAMFKALLFMSAGSIIHSVIYESQDIRTFGGLIHYLPVTYISILIASLSLMAIPGLSGFYSKDLIIESAYGVYSLSGFTLYWFAITSATLTSIYSFRLLYLIFYNIPNANRYTYYSIHESDYKMLIPMIILAILSIFIGYLTRDIYLGFGSPFNSIFTHPSNLSLVDIELSLPTSYKLLPLILTILSVSSVLFIYEYNYNWLPNIKNSYVYNLYLYTNNKFMLDQIINNIILRSSLSISILSSQFIDKGLLQIYGPTGLYNSANKDSIFNQTNTNIRHYGIYLLILLIIISFIYYISLIINYSIAYNLILLLLITLPFAL